MYSFFFPQHMHVQLHRGQHNRHSYAIGTWLRELQELRREGHFWFLEAIEGCGEPLHSCAETAGVVVATKQESARSRTFGWEHCGRDPPSIGLARVATEFTLVAEPLTVCQGHPGSYHRCCQ